MKIVKEILKRGKKKLRDSSGESLVETLVSMLIVVLAFTMLSGAIVAAARVNAGAEKQTLYLNEAETSDNQDTGIPVTIKIPGSDITTGKTVRTYEMKDGAGTLYYYE